MKNQKVNAITVVFAVIILAIYFSLAVGLTIIFSNLQSMKYLWLISFVTIFSALFLIYLGLEFYSLRLFVPAIYGALEICVALLSVVLISKSFDITKYLATFTALYIIVRGFDNIHRHYGKPGDNPKKDYWFKKAVNKKLLLAHVFDFMSNYIEEIENGKKIIKKRK